MVDEDRPKPHLFIQTLLVIDTASVIRHMTVSTDLHKKVVFRKIEIGANLLSTEKHKWFVLEFNIFPVEKVSADLLVLGSDFDS